MRLMLFLLQPDAPRLSIFLYGSSSQKNIFNDKTRIENDKLKKEEEKKISVVGKQFREAWKDVFFLLSKSLPLWRYLR